MIRLEWWWDLDQGFVAPADLLAETFGTEVAGYRATVHLPSVPVNVRAGSFLAPPQGERATSGEPSESWGMVLSSKGGEAIGVVVKRMVLTAEIADASGVDLQRAARSILDDMDTWWDIGRTWLEVVTGQHLTRVGHQETSYVGDKTPVWHVTEGDAQMTPISLPATVHIQVGGGVRGVLQTC